MSESSAAKSFYDFLNADPDIAEVMRRAEAEDAAAIGFVEGAINIDALKKIAHYVSIINPRSLGFLRRATGGAEDLVFTKTTDFDLRHLGLFLALVITMRDKIQADSSGSDKPKRDRKPSDFIPSDFLGSDND